LYGAHSGVPAFGLDDFFELVDEKAGQAVVKDPAGHEETDYGKLGFKNGVLGGDLVYTAHLGCQFRK